MKMLFFTLCISLSLFSCNGCADHKLDKVANPIKGRMEIKADLLKEAYSKNNYFVFFKEFPDTFADFLSLYGFDDEKGAMPLYSCYDKHVRSFFYSYDLNKEKFIPKLFNLGKEGHWEADATSVLQENILIFMKNHSKDMVEYLETKPENEVSHFWHYVFDGSSRNDTTNNANFDTIYKLIKAINKKQANILKEEFLRMYE
ncbi:hypothetical protein [uncultured Bacteroides sp.]|uniref:hypothetical protein n=1 Tax=uncultured Bacteroides sp. TaxID=162156 RepID=UPI002AAC3E57|nr:hypothetical protein [uncultured Bacteroides sp.]